MDPKADYEHEQRMERTIGRIETAETDAFITLYRHAAERCGTGWHEVAGIQTVWSPHDDDPGYSCIINLADASDPAAVIVATEQAARAAGACVLGVDGSPAVSDLVGDALLLEHGFEHDIQECMWGREINSDETIDTSTPPGVSIERVTVSDAEVFARTLNVGYDLDEDAIRGHVFAAAIGKPGWTHYLALFDGRPGAASVLYVSGDVADLFVATTMPPFRGRGAQSTLIRWRLADGQAANCTLATSQTVIDNASPRNMARHGFEPLYYRWIWGKSLAS